MTCLRRRRFAPCLSLVACLAAAPALAAPPPQRIVSANLCADRLVLALAGPERVAAVSRFAADPDASTVAAAASGLAVTSGEVEDIAARRPDLVVLGAFNASGTAPRLRALGIRVHVVPAGATLADAAQAIRGLAQVLGEEGRGAAMVAAIQDGLAALPRPERPRRVVVYQAGGWSAGRGTLADELLAAAGLVNVAAEAGLVGFGSLPLEELAAARPDLIVIESMGEEKPSMAGMLLGHPALAAVSARVVVPMRLWSCPDPALVEAAALIARAARATEAQ